MRIARSRDSLIALMLLAAVVLGGFFLWQQRAVVEAPGLLFQASSGRGLTSFQSDEELRQFLQQRMQRRVRRGDDVQTFDVAESPPPMESNAEAVPMPSPVAPPPMEQASPEVAVTGSRVAQPGITNVQEVGVDEGGIVKTYRDMLVILRRGRLFTVSLARGGMEPIDTVNAYPAGVSGRGDYYDEMLISGDRVIVIGYSYARGGTEINRFRITPDGQLSFEDAYHLRSNDYYSSRNYASRLIGNQLIYYTPLALNRRGDPLDWLPGVRKWTGNERGAFRRIADARKIFIAPGLRDDPDARIDTLHSVVSCDLTADDLDCDATGVLGPSSRTFYVSGKAVYLWTTDNDRSNKRGEASAQLYRLPFADDEVPAAIGARGAPVDQFSFREDADGERIDVLVRAEGGGDAMWRPEASAGAVALLQVPIAAFGDGRREAELSLYRDLPAPRGNAWSFHNRFVGDYVLYGVGGPGRADGGGAARLVAAPVNRAGSYELPLPHGVDRIEALGRDALVVGGMDGDLVFTAVDLFGRAPRVGDRYVQQASAEGETRSHAFFFSPDRSAPDGASGTLGLPIAKPVAAEYRRFFGTAAAMLFLRRDDRRFSRAGELDAEPAGTVDDDCRASCVDWYGNARPIFMSNRVFALLGYELVEGRMRGGQIREIGRTNFAPRRSGGRGK